MESEVGHPDHPESVEVSPGPADEGRACYRWRGSGREAEHPLPGTGKPPSRQSPRQDDEDCNSSSCSLQREGKDPLLMSCWVTGHLGCPEGAGTDGRGGAHLPVPKDLSHRGRGTGLEAGQYSRGQMPGLTWPLYPGQITAPFWASVFSSGK